MAHVCLLWNCECCCNKLKGHLHKESAQDWGTTLPRRTFMQKLARALITPSAEKRLASNPRMSSDLKNVISTVCGIQIPTRGAQPGQVVIADSCAPMIRCALCPRTEDRKTQHRCTSCGRAVCLCNIFSVCIDCPHEQRKEKLNLSQSV